MATQSQDVIIVGAGHNGLVAATFLARAGLKVTVVETAAVIGGACRTEYPFAKAPQVGASTGAYLLGLMPPELIAKLGIDLPTIARKPHYFLPTQGPKHLLLGPDREAAREQFVAFFSEADWKAHGRLERELRAIRADIAPSWLQNPLSIEASAERWIRPELRQVFIDLCRGSVGAYLDRFGFQSELLQAMYAVTDGFTGLDGGWDSPGSGMNFLVHNMCRLPGSDGTWMLVRGGMGTVSARLADAARQAGAQILTSCAVASIQLRAGSVSGVLLEDGRELSASVVVVNADPFRMQSLVGQERMPEPFNERLQALRRDGTTMKVNLCLRELPVFTSLPQDRGQYGTTIHLLPEEGTIRRTLAAAFSDAKAGRLPEHPSIEWYIHSTLDPSLRDGTGRHSAALFVQWVPYAITGSSWEAEEAAFVRHLLSICDRFAPGTSTLVEDVFALSPPGIERHFGISRGHIHHVDNSFGFADRWPYRGPLPGLYSASAGCHPAGSVIGAAGHNAAQCVLEDLG